MQAQGKKIFVIALVVVIAIGVRTLYFREQPPKKPAEIPPGDYTYTIEYTLNIALSG